MVADRGDRSNKLISPKKSPASARARTCSIRPLTTLEMMLVPFRTTNISSPGSPSRKSTWRGLRFRSSSRAANASSSLSVNSRKSFTLLRNAAMSAVAAIRMAAAEGADRRRAADPTNRRQDSGRVRPGAGAAPRRARPPSPRRSGRDAAEQGGAQDDRALVGRSVGQSDQGSLDGCPLVIAQLVLGKDRVGRSLQIGQEVGINHRAAD